MRIVTVARYSAMVGLLAALGCPNAVDMPAPPGPPIAIISISPNAQTIGVGDSLLFHATTNVAGNTGFSWTVNSTALAVVSTIGWVRALGAGDVLVQACGQPSTTVCGNAVLHIR